MNRILRLWHCTICLCLLADASSAVASAMTIRSYQLPDRGILQLQVPKEWDDQLHQPPDRLPPTIEFRQKTGTPFKMLITTLWAMNPGMTMLEGDGLRQNMQQAVDRISSRAVEKTINLVELKGPSVYGYYFSVTDRESKPGEYKYMAQGQVRVGELVAIFTIFTNEGEEGKVSEGLEVIRSAFHRIDVPLSSIPIRFFFDGKPKYVGNPADEKLYNSTGIVVRAQDKSFIGLFNDRLKYSIFLPYSEKWMFDLENDHLSGKAETVNFDILVWKGSDAPEHHLMRLKESLSSSSNSLATDRVEFVHFEKEIVLRNEIDVERINPLLKGAKQINFYSVKKYGDALYKFHMTVMAYPEKLAPLDERKLLYFVTKGFSVGSSKQ